MPGLPATLHGATCYKVAHDTQAEVLLVTKILSTLRSATRTAHLGGVLLCSTCVACRGKLTLQPFHLRLRLLRLRLRGGRLRAERLLHPLLLCRSLGRTLRQLACRTLMCMCQILRAAADKQSCIAPSRQVKVELRRDVMYTDVHARTGVQLVCMAAMD